MDALLEQTVNESYLQTFKQDGLFVFRNLVTPENLQVLISETHQLQNIILQKIKNLKRPLENYSDIAERQLGRLDYRCGFIGETFTEIAQPIIKLIHTMSPSINFRYYWGAIPALSSSGPTDMHRDIYPLLNTTQGMDIGEFDAMLPPYYFTVLIPLVEITNENGPTQFIKGSYKELCVDVDKAEIYSPLLSPGDVVIFDGRTMHKGSANHSKEERLIAYITFVAEWYHDQTFVINKYLFPELAVPGR